MDSHYPNGARADFHVGEYADIANRQYYEVSKLFNEIKQHDFDQCEENSVSISKMRKSVIITTVFSGMAIEAFFNDYAASCLGDDAFYESFDSLSVIGKFDLIASFILNVKIDKSKAYYSFLKMLNKKRNDYVHSKSRKFDIDAERSAIISKLNDEIFLSEYGSSFEREANELLLEARNALRALREIAVFFDEKDTHSLALSLFFPSCYAFSNEGYPHEMTATIAKDLSLKLPKNARPNNHQA